MELLSLHQLKENKELGDITKDFGFNHQTKVIISILKSNIKIKTEHIQYSKL